MIRKNPTRNTYKLPYPYGLKKQVTEYHKQMKLYDTSLGEISEEKDLEDALNTLRQDEQRVLILHYKDHMSKKDIAASLDISYDKVCAFHKSGIQHLMKKLCL